MGSSAANLCNRDIDLARLRLLNPNIFDESLTREESQAIAAHMMSNVPQLLALLKSLRPEEEPLVADVETVLSLCPVISLNKSRAGGAAARRRRDGSMGAEDVVYTRGKPSEVCCVVLSGKLELKAGKDQITAEMGPFSVLGADALLPPGEGADTSVRGPYVPDFTAYAQTDEVRYLRITRTIFQAGYRQDRLNGESKGRTEQVRADQRSQKALQKLLGSNLVS